MAVGSEVSYTKITPEQAVRLDFSVVLFGFLI